jgi:hypothetical protein
MDENLFSPVRILSTWCKSFSIFYITFADIRHLAMKLNKSKINTILNTLASKWETDSSIYITNSVEPPHIDSISQYLKTLKK